MLNKEQHDYAQQNGYQKGAEFRLKFEAWLKKLFGRKK
jgi:hypothetical protein